MKQHNTETKTGSMSSYYDGFHQVDGVWFSQYITEENVRKVRSFPVQDQEVLVCGYPKSGNIWMMKTIASIFRRTGTSCGTELACFPLELDLTVSKIDNVPRPTILMSHLRYNMLPVDVERKNIKMVHITRNPKDCVISYLHFQKVLKFVTVTPNMDEFIAQYAKGKVPFGTWFEYMKDWLKQKDNPNILFVKYEDYVRNPRKIVVEVANFLGKNLPPESVDEILAETSFGAMKAKDHKSVDPEVYDTKRGGHVRKGKIGDWKDHLNEEQNEVFDKAYIEFVKDTGYTIDFE